MHKQTRYQKEMTANTELIRINEVNISQLAELVPAELRSNLGREYFRGLGIRDDDDTFRAALIWELKSLEDGNEPTRAEILCFAVSERSDGEMLLEAFEQDIREDGVSIISIETESMEDVLKNILSDFGYTIKETEGRDIVVSVSELKRLRLGKRNIPDYIRSISDITSIQFKAAVMSAVFHGRYGLLDDLPFVPMTRFDPDLSSCVITDEKVTGLLLIHRTLNGTYIVELLFALQPDANINLLNMIRYSIRAADEFLSMDDRVILRVHNRSTGLLVKKLFPNKRGDRVIKGEKTRRTDK